MEDLVLERQAEIRALHDKALSKHGWKLGKVGVRNVGVIVYELVRTDGHRIEHTMLLSDILHWSTVNPPGMEPAPSTLMLRVALLLRVKHENRVHPWVEE